MVPQIDREEVVRLAKKQRNVAIGHRIIAAELHDLGFLEDSIEHIIESQKADEYATRLELKLKRANK